MGTDRFQIQHRDPTSPQRRPQHPRRPITYVPPDPRQPVAIPHPPRPTDASLRERVPRCRVLRQREAWAEMAYTRRSRASRFGESVSVCEGPGQRLSEVREDHLSCISPFLPTSYSPSQTHGFHAIPEADPQIFRNAELHMQTPTPLAPPLPPPSPLPYLPLRPTPPPRLLPFFPLRLHNQHPPLRPLRRRPRNRRHDVPPRVDMAHAIRD